MASSSHGIHRINRHRPISGPRIRTPSLRTLIRKRRQILHRHAPENAHFESQDDSCQALLPIQRSSRNFKEPADTDGLKSAILRLNVGGTSFMLKHETIRKRNTGILLHFIRLNHDQRLQLCDDYFEITNEYYFERAPALFHVIYQYYITGLIHQPSQICSQDMLNELEYWKIDPSPALASCCCSEDPPDDSLEEELLGNKAKRSDSLSDFKRLRFGGLRYTIWQIMEQPGSSIYAQVFGSLSIMCVLISISGLILGSIPELQVHAYKDKNSSHGFEELEPHPILDRIEYVCIVWFIMEYSIKMLVSSNRLRTFLQLLNIIDLLSILPFMMEMSLMLAGINTEKLRNFKGALLVMRILRVLRVVRILKLGRYSSGLQLFGKTLRASIRQLGMMAMVVMTGVIFFSTLVYFIEKDEPNTQFVSIPAAMWWSLVTMTTVGYGDITPITVCGKLVATVAICAGVLVLALPITIIVDNFMKVAESERQNEFLNESMATRETSQISRTIIPTDPTNSPPLPESHKITCSFG